MTHRLFLPTRHRQREPLCSLSLQRTTKKAEVGRQDRRCALEAGTGKQEKAAVLLEGQVNSHHRYYPCQRDTHCVPYIVNCQVKRPYSFTQRHLRTHSHRTEASRHGWEVRLLTPPCHSTSHL